MHSDIREYIQSKSLNEQGIFCIFDDDDLFHVRAMILGPEETPYAYGFYFFDLHFPKEYPFKPPRVSYQTRWRNIRFHPNLYASSKVCLSILGTWSGPGWTSAQTLSSVLLTIQSLLTKDPLTNEPGYTIRTSKTESRHNNYETMVTFENYNTAIGRMLDTPPKGFEAFLPIMYQCFKTNSGAIEKQLQLLLAKEPTPSKMRCAVYNFESMVDYASCCSKLQSLKQLLMQDEETPPDKTEISPQMETCTIETLQAPTTTPPTLPTTTPPTLPTTTPPPRIKKPTRKASENEMRGQIVTIDQGPNKDPIQFESRKCKQKNANQPEKWQWRRLASS